MHVGHSRPCKVLNHYRHKHNSVETSAHTYSLSEEGFGYNYGRLKSSAYNGACLTHKNTPSHISYHAEFGRSRSVRNYGYHPKKFDPSSPALNPSADFFKVRWIKIFSADIRISD